MPHPSLRRAARIAAFALAATAGPVLAQAPAAAPASAARVQELERRLEQSLRVIEELSTRVRQLEARGTSPAPAAAAAAPAPAPAPAAAQAAAPQDARLATLEQQVDQLTRSASRGNADAGVPLHGFADVGFAGRRGADGLPKGANICLLDFYLTPSFGDRVKTLVELVFEVDSGGAIATDLERLQVGYTFSDLLTTWAGRFHTPYGYWNTAFHHGAQIQTSILRPKFLDFEDKGGILPAHTVGFWSTGAKRLGDGRLTYDVFAGNSPRIGTDGGTTGTGTLNPNLATSTNHSASVGFNAGWEFGGALDGLKVGAHGMRFRTRDDVQPFTNTTDVRFVGGYGIYLENAWEVLTEYYRFSNDDVTNGTGTHTSNAWYGQVGRNFGMWTPYARLERTRLDQNDPYFAVQESGGSYKRSALGLRYDVNRRAAVKLEWNRTTFQDRDAAGYSEGRVQFAVRF